MTTLHDVGGVLGRPLDTFLWVSWFHGHSSWLMCQVPVTHLSILIGISEWGVVTLDLRMELNKAYVVQKIGVCAQMYPSF
jgi:hypothetical protein